MADPNPQSVFDLEADAAVEARLDAEAEAEVAAGQTVPHDKVRIWLKDLAQGRKTPPPTR
ncbi:hypothetical protein ACELLULO517_01625 [Acidisoma cellulosilytica]|uniref:CopG family transcriptional regulator n=1 Tax=Acidisoma cellulosilyticum TaxID=2802395 RepID=A0A963YXG2_9PROT|nr:hypothetical protein [Acidisoma cellulosilyticum]MCB8878916.1 hypothetical protein [Acidisoma cellulosilyticum]